MELAENPEIKKKSQISVTVEEVLPDILVVSFRNQNKLYEGVLLNSSKKLLPCGIIASPLDDPPNDIISKQANNCDEMFAISQRFSYFQEKSIAPLENLFIEGMKRTIRPPARYKHARTVRLRPRQVLCSKCRGICNENSENVNISGKTKRCSNEETDTARAKKIAKFDRQLLRPSRDLSPAGKSPDEPPLVKSKKLAPPRPISASNGNRRNSNDRPRKMRIVGVGSNPLELNHRVAVPEKDPLSMLDECDGFPHHVYSNGSTCDDLDPLDVSVLPENSRLSSMEDLSNDLEKSSQVSAFQRVKTKTPVIKISYSSNTGEGTVLKIASKPQGVLSHENEAILECTDDTKRNSSAKAAKKALRKAKKEAKRNVTLSKLTDASSPSQRYSASSPHYTTCISPKLMGSTSPQPVVKKHKHKGKHKKKHKIEKKSEDERLKSVNNEQVEECLTQKLSISLKRLKSCASIRGDSSPAVSDCSDDPIDAVPNFPGHLNDARGTDGLMISFKTSDGKQICVGDVVWGKIHGFPWWPGKVLSIAERKSDVDEGSPSQPTAHVAWYGSSTSSLVSASALNPFLEAFQVRFNKKKRGPYKEAIKQATAEAQNDLAVTEASLGMKTAV